MTDPLLHEIDVFLSIPRVQRITATGLGKHAVNDPHFVADLRKGRRVLSSTAQKVRDFMAKHGHKTHTGHA